jgi:hypothetical protein
MEISKNNLIKNRRNLWKDVNAGKYHVNILFYHNIIDLYNIE